MIPRTSDWPIPPVPHYGGRLNGLGDADSDAAMLAAVVADAQATQAMHKEMIQHMADWEARQPGVLSSDDDLRNQFISNLDALRSAFTDRGLQTVGVPFPILLDRTNPAHAVILAVRDDIADTVSKLQANQAQYVLGKQIQDVRVSLPEKLVNQAVSSAKDLTSSAAAAVAAGGKGLSDALGSLAWIVGGGFGLYLLYQMTRGGK